uniref:Expressed conserved protein n=1 Tax=Echinococcus granulosus TaxID=6210 RepID=A0A068WFR0_ECHGR|nr:hypothetical protein EgrG_002019800 [Echinococcus granulosus]
MHQSIGIVLFTVLSTTNFLSSPTRKHQMSIERVTRDWSLINLQTEFEPSAKSWKSRQTDLRCKGDVVAEHRMKRWFKNVILMSNHQMVHHVEEGPLYLVPKNGIMYRRGEGIEIDLVGGRQMRSESTYSKTCKKSLGLRNSGG